MLIIIIVKIVLKVNIFQLILRIGTYLPKQQQASVFVKL